MQALCLYVSGCLAADDGRRQHASMLFGRAQAMFAEEKRDSWVVKCMIQQAGILFDAGFLKSAIAMLSFDESQMDLDAATIQSLLLEREMFASFVSACQAARN